MTRSYQHHRHAGLDPASSKSGLGAYSRYNHILYIIVGLAIGFLSLLFILTITSIIALTLLFQHWWPVANQIRQAADLSWSEVYQLATQLPNIEPRTSNLTWLILGTDQLTERGKNQPILTDTIMLAQVDISHHTVTLLSIPRDVWLPDQGRKINTIYQNNLTKFQNQYHFQNLCSLEPTSFTPHPGLTSESEVTLNRQAKRSLSEIILGSTILFQGPLGHSKTNITGSSNSGMNKGFEMLDQIQRDENVDYYCRELQNTFNQLVRQQTLQDFSQILDIPIDQLLIVDMELVPQLIDAIGGVEVNVETAFTDYNYPRSDVDVTIEKDPRKLYETVSFEAGPIKLDGQTALKFMRSRKAQNSEGNDLARARRQQLVITSLIDQLVASLPPQSASQVVEYLNLYQSSLADQLPLTELAKIFISLPGSPLNYSIRTASLPVIPIDQDGVLFESPRHSSGQWAFEMTSLKDFQKAIRDQLDVLHSATQFLSS